jgi:hypothetical protein
VLVPVLIALVPALVVNLVVLTRMSAPPAEPQVGDEPSQVPTYAAARTGR